jgi:pSer/pThr/pTyr-binding forkhead associated (FHA) protein
VHLPEKNRSTRCAILRYCKIDNMPKLILTTESQGRLSYELTEALITIGRAPDNIIVIDDPSISSRHAQLELSGELYRLKDLDSTNGTRVNGIPVTETVLRFDDRIRLGGVEARFEPDARGSQPLPALKQIEAKPAETSAAPVDFANASPFPRRSKDRDRVRSAILALAAASIFVFLGSMIAVLTMHAPNL